MVTTVNNQTSSTGSASAGLPSIASALGGDISDLFVKLLVAQIRNQNPLEPTDPAAFVGQLSQLSQVEALRLLADQGTASASAMASMQVISLGSQVGTDVTVQTSQVQLDKEPVQVDFTLSSPSTKTTLVLTGTGGRKFSIELGTKPIGTVSTAVDPAALGIPAGSYALSVETSTKETPATSVTGLLGNVQIGANGAAMVLVAGVGQVPASSLVGFHGRPITVN
ncbi:basal-body rod modification protein FlgD [Pseudorhodoferax aquiterrae]|uniref:Basal-body rod modification protein FlgD n=1 Tax=Pseudorhodoferax aquiterrae TaxID=747304 RepID=A0ABQ3GGF9_9BURK|nr:flagellar hook capping FlgD N-terminal domain-containing protein [Pseudorhodoferax aquiterrae]GHD03262.1 basal-body rod modification protein FlgD [Pseudorhodoferax aquiterrae]